MRDAQPAEQPLDTAEFRKLMGLFATGVCVVSVEGGERGIVGMTVNSLVSVSLDPMLVCWSLQNSSSQFELYTQADRFAVSILAHPQQGLAQRYASRKGAKLETGDFTMSAAGLPVVHGALGYLECRRWSLYPAGDHTMIFGEVSGLHLPGQIHEPLGFFNGRFCTIGD